MTHFMDKLPYDFSDPAGRELWNLLADNYFSRPPVIDLVRQANISPADIEWDQSMRWVWAQILEVARKQNKLRPLIGVVSGSVDEAVAERLKELLAAEPITAAPEPAVSVGPAWKGPGNGNTERIIFADSTLLDVSFLRQGLLLSAAVCRLLVTLSGSKYYGTAFRIAEDLVLTNHHVLFDSGGSKATAVEAWFGYERTFAGLDAMPTVVQGDVTSIVGALDHDWAVVRLPAMPPDTPIIGLTGAKPVNVDDRVYIIQHPSGSPKKIGMIHNVVRYSDDSVVQYLTDTEGGSSGSPVFNERWELVALHHQWTTATVNGTTEYRNQGQRIERVIEGLKAAQVI
jgi:V8-like Glu-specific endopeptidase